MGLKIRFFLLVFVISFKACFSQGVSNLWLIGYQNGGLSGSISNRGTIDFITGSAVVDTSNRKMKFRGTQANITDNIGNLLIASNGTWIANAYGDTMLNGSGLNPNSFTDDWLDGLPLPYGNVIIPWPDDTTKYVLFHMTGNYGTSTLSAAELYYSIIDLTMDNGNGGVVSKNQIVLQDELGWGIGACKHANGRDWWIIVMKDNSNKLYKVLLTPSGVTVSDQIFTNPICYLGNANQPVFSPDGTKFAFTTGYSTSITNLITKVSYFEFDRCTGIFSNHQMIDVTDYHIGFGTMFSPNSKFLYAATTNHIFQINTDSLNILVDTIATYDGYYSPSPPFATDFWLMYLAQDEKIYITSGSSVLDIGYINFPDSTGVFCDVHQHALHTPCYSYRNVPNHPNYFLGADSASICDSLTSSIYNIKFDSNKALSISPNPATNFITVNAMNVKGSKAMLRIYNSVGELIGTIDLNIYGEYATQDIYIETLPTGVYIVRLENEEDVFVGKFVKEDR